MHLLQLTVDPEHQVSPWTEVQNNAAQPPAVPFFRDLWGEVGGLLATFGEEVKRDQSDDR